MDPASIADKNILGRREKPLRRKLIATLLYGFQQPLQVRYHKMP
jgi:hypothetical protein